MSHALKKMPISVSVIVKGDDVVFNQLPDDITALQLMEEISKKHGFPVGEIKPVTVQGAKTLKGEEVLAAEKKFQKLRMALNFQGGCSF